MTAVELLPIHHFVDDSFLVGRGLTNYWGYSTIGYFAPDGRYSSSGTPAAHWSIVLDTTEDTGFKEEESRHEGGKAILLAARSLVLLRRIA